MGEFVIVRDGDPKTGQRMKYYLCCDFLFMTVPMTFTRAGDHAG
jgi:hypothetical protein